MGIELELDVYKQNRINENNAIFNANVSRLYSTTLRNIRNVQKSRQTNIRKQRQINSLINQYNTNVNRLKINLDKSNLGIQNFIPKNIIIKKNKKALLIGINYTGTSNELFGCINDAINVKERITNQGFTDITVLTDLTTKKPTRNNILEEFKNLLINSKEGDLLFLSYSGHGSYALDKNGDEKTGYDQLIFPSDSKVILDDELKTIIQRHLNPGATLFAMFDSCFSGSVLDLRYQYMDSLNYNKFTENNKQLETKGRVFMISGCSDYQTSTDAFINNKATGAMTWSLLEALNKLPKCSWRELVIKMRDLLQTSQYDQIPQFSCGTFEDIDLPNFI